MLLCNERYRVAAAVEVKPLLDDFDVVHNPSGIAADKDAYMARVLRIRREDGKYLAVALLDMVCADTAHCAVLEGDVLTVILFSTIVRIGLDDGSIIQLVECGNAGGLLEIHPIPGGYIIRGEGDIFRYDRELNRVWQFCGRDIFVCPEAERDFWLEHDRIHCVDWEGWHYTLDMDGKLMRDVREMSPYS